MDPMVLSVLYIWCQLNRDTIVSFWFGMRFKVRAAWFDLFVYYISRYSSNWYGDMYKIYEATYCLFSGYVFAVGVGSI